MISKLFQQIIAVTNVLAALGLLLSMLAPYVSPASINMLAIFGLTFPYLVIVNVLFVLFWLNFKKAFSLISFSLLLVIVGINISKRHNNESTIQDETTCFSLMSYNVRLFDLYNWTKNKQSRDSIFTFIRKEKPDIICFQEYFNSSNKNYFPIHDSLIKNQSFKYYHIYYTNQIKGNKFGIATYSNYPIINKQNHTFENTNNLYISSDILINKDTVRVLNCHLESIRLQQADYNLMDSLRSVAEARRRAGLKGIVKRIQHAFIIRATQAEHIQDFISQSPYPVICSGDFNDTPNSYSYKTIASELTDAYHSTNSFHGGTYNRFFPAFRIDFLLFNDDIYCESFKTFDVDLSDHKPIKGSFHIESRK